MKGSFTTGGALSFKGDKKAKKKKSKSKHKSASKSEDPAVAAAKVAEPIEEMTEAERKAAVRKKERERKDLEKLAQKSHRETIEDFNEKLGNLTEHNDIPRVSAAGNG